MKKKLNSLTLFFLIFLVGFIFYWITPRIFYLVFLNNAGSQLNMALSSIDGVDRLPSVCIISPVVKETQNKIIPIQNEIEKATFFSPKGSKSYLLLGRIKCLMGDYLGAFQSFSYFIQLKPQNPLGYIESGFALEKTGDIETAVKYWKSIEDIDYHFLEVGKEYQQEKLFSEAIKWFERALLINPGRNEYWYRTFLVYQELGNFNQGLETLLKGSKETKEVYGLSNIYYQIGWILQYYQIPSNIDGAWNAYSQALSIDNFSFNTLQKAATYSNRGFLLSQQGQTAEAIEQFEIAIQLEPNFYWPHLGLARSLWQIGQYEEAKRLAYYALNLSPNPVDAYLTLGDFCRDEHNFVLAQEMYEEALKINPESINAKKALHELEIMP